VENVIAINNYMNLAYQLIYTNPPWHFRVHSEKGGGRSAKNPYPMMNLDDNKTDFPSFRGLSLAPWYAELNIMYDVDGNPYVAISAGAGAIVGVGHNEGYLCNWGSTCSQPSASEIEQAISGICLGGEALFVTGINISALCHGFNLDLAASSVSTFYLRAEAGLGAGVTLTVPLSFFGVGPEPTRGWRWALINQQNGVTYPKIVACEGQQ
jgi:hypothetical protein